MEEERIPIKKIVEDTAYEYDFHIVTNFYVNGDIWSYTISLFRRFYIACLNLGFIMLGELEDINDKFFSRIDCVQYIHYQTSRTSLSKNELMKLKTNGFYIKGSTIIIFDPDSYDMISAANRVNHLIELPEYDITFFKAITEVLFGELSELSSQAVYDCLSEITAERIYNMDINEERIMMPNTVSYQIGNNSIDIRVGYKDKLNMMINFLKQMFVAYDINHDRMIFDAFEKSFNVVYSELPKSFLANVDKYESLYKTYIQRVVCDNPYENELDLINQFQLDLSKCFSDFNRDSLTFVSMITSDKLRKKIMDRLIDVDVENHIKENKHNDEEKDK